MYRKRWATVSHCVVEVDSIKSILCWGWCKDGYEKSATKNTADGGVEVSKVDECITSSDWWSAITVLLMLSKVLTMAVAWCVGCPCHFGVEDECNCQRLSQLWKSCPMRGRRLPEIAAGAFTEYVKLTLESMKAKLVVDLPRDISAERRAGLVAEFERAGAMLLFTFTLKTSSLAVPPGLLFKCGHHNDVLARDALLKCLASSSSHE